MFKAQTLCKGGLRTGLPALDRLLDIGDGIITLRSESNGLLSWLASSIIIRNHLPGSDTLYVHWVDYHRRYWTVDLDLMVRMAKKLGVDTAAIMDGVHFVRMFSRDCTEAGENWDKIYGFSSDVRLAVLDSVSELYEAEDDAGMRRGPDAKGAAYSIRKFLQLCMMNSCHGLVLDSSRRSIHPYLGEVSSIVLKLFCRERLYANVLKHPCMLSSTVDLGMPDPQPSLMRWML